MPSLMKRLFETMPLAGLKREYAGDVFTLPVGQLAGHLFAYIDENAYKVDPPKPTAETIDRASHGDTIPIWGWTSNLGSPSLSQVTCRVRDDDFKQYVVLDRLEFGFSPAESPTDLRNCVRVHRREGIPWDLPLDERFRLATFVAMGGELWEDDEPLFPLRSLHDPCIVHVYAFDIPVLGLEPRSLKDPDHPDRLAIDVFLGNVVAINGITADDGRVSACLFDDDVWRPQPAPADAGSTLGDDLWEELSLAPTRVVIAISTTFCKERDDYVMGHFTPAWLVGMARVYPHIMVLSTRALDRVESAIRFTRPTHTTIVGGHVCGCGEMLTDIGMGFWNDVNAGNEVDSDVLDGTPYWENIFNYYLIDPDKDPELLGKRCVFAHAYGGATTTIEGAIYRWAGIEPWARERVGRIERTQRQGVFDNVHLAPRMKVKQVFDSAGIFRQPGQEAAELKVASAAFVDHATWKMDRVVMAPFCAHDCFHLHTRWGDAMGVEKPTRGFSLGGPYRGAASPMLPVNHAAYVTPLGPNAFIYSEESFKVKAEEWDICCYQGAGYACSVGGALDLAIRALSRGYWQYLKPEPEPSWALFYWFLRYHFEFDGEGKLVVAEAVDFVDRAAALKP